MKFENTAVFNIEGALRGMRLPLKSGAKADSHYCLPNECQICSYNCSDFDGWEPYMVGKNDLKLAQTLVGSGSPHDKFMRQIFVSVDITAPLYWWKEMDQYKVGTVTDSESTMHKLASTPITLDCFETDDFDKDFEIIPYTSEENEEDGSIVVGFGYDAEMMADNIIEDMERLRQKYNETGDKRYWKELIRWLPEGWLQTRTWTANYVVLRGIYFQRKDHKLTEWHQFCDWIKTLPYSEQLITYKKEN